MLSNYTWVMFVVLQLAVSMEKQKQADEGATNQSTKSRLGSWSSICSTQTVEDSHTNEEVC
jgi:hypothetical protein